jgi:hypothetical protein
MEDLEDEEITEKSTQEVCLCHNEATQGGSSTADSTGKPQRQTTWRVGDVTILRNL